MGLWRAASRTTGTWLVTDFLKKYLKNDLKSTKNPLNAWVSVEEDMSRKNITPGQQTLKVTAQNNAATTDASHDANNDHEANASGASNTEILNAIRSLKQDVGKQSADMLEVVNSIKGDLVSHSKRIGETEERISQTEEDVTALQQKAKTTGRNYRHTAQ